MKHETRAGQKENKCRERVDAPCVSSLSPQISSADLHPFDNTIVSAGDIGYLWGMFLLVASARKAGMSEPFIFGTRGFGQTERRVLEQFGAVQLLPLDGTKRSLTCLKSHVMLTARTPIVTWADSDGFFTGDVSAIMPPSSPEAIHFRVRPPDQMPAAFRGHEFGENGTRIPMAVREAWRRDVAEVAGSALDSSRRETTGSASFFSLSLDRHRKFLEIWDALQQRVLPERDVGVVDKSLSFYHQLDESTLNACLCFAPDAPLPEPEYRMDKDRSRLFVHFVSRPKPWVGWTRRALRFFDEYISVVEWAEREGVEMPGPVPPSLQRSYERRARILARWTELKPKLASRFKKVRRAVSMIATRSST